MATTREQKIANNARLRARVGAQAANLPPITAKMSDVAIWAQNQTLDRLGAAAVGSVGSNPVVTVGPAIPASNTSPTYPAAATTPSADQAIASQTAAYLAQNDPQWSTYSAAEKNDKVLESMLGGGDMNNQQQAGAFDMNAILPWILAAVVVVILFKQKK